MATIPQGMSDPTALQSHLERVGNYWWRIEKPSRPNVKGPQHNILFVGKNTVDAGSDNLDFLVETIGHLGPGQYIIASQPPSEGDKWRAGGLHTPFNIAGTPTNAMAGIAGLPPGAIHGSGFISKAEMHDAIADAREKWDLERRLDDLQAQLDNPSSTWERIGDALLPHVDKILPPIMDRIGLPKSHQQAVISGFGDATPAVPASAAGQGTDDADHGEQPMDQQAYDQAIHAALVKWHQAEPDMLTVLEALSELAHTDPQKYAMGKNLLGL